jgi:hypothetical protein
MKNLKIEGSAFYEDEHIPEVDFNAESGKCEISGESFPEHALEFYTPLINWLKEYFQFEKKPLTFNFRLKYYNTSSSKRIFEILCFLKEYEKKGGKVEVNWYFDEDDPEQIIEVEDLMLASRQKINILIEEQNS